MTAVAPTGQAARPQGEPATAGQAAAQRHKGFSVGRAILYVFLTVVSVGYQGGHSTVHLVTESGRSLRAHLPSAAALGFARGAAAWASWIPRDAVVITE